MIGGIKTCEEVELERKESILYQLSRSRQIRESMEEALQLARRSTSSDANFVREVLFNQQSTVDELVTLTQAVRGGYTLDAYTCNSESSSNNRSNLNEYEEEKHKILEASEKVIHDHLNDSNMDEYESIRCKTTKNDSLITASSPTTTHISKAVRTVTSAIQRGGTSISNANGITSKNGSASIIAKKQPPFLIAKPLKHYDNINTNNANHHSSTTEMKNPIAEAYEKVPQHKLLQDLILIGTSKSEESDEDGDRPLSSLASNPITRTTSISNSTTSNDNNSKYTTGSATSFRGTRARKRSTTGTTSSTTSLSTTATTTRRSKTTSSNHNSTKKTQSQHQQQHHQNNKKTDKRCHFCKNLSTYWIRCTYYQPTGAMCRNYFCKDCMEREFASHPKIVKLKEWHGPCCLGTCTCRSCTSSRKRRRTA